MWKKGLSTVILVILALALAVPAGAITWGEPDGNLHPQVVTLLFQQTDGLYSCSGTLLTPYVVLTAGHCTESGGVTNLATWVRNDSDIDAAYAAERPLYPSLADWLADKWIMGAAIPHPDYNDFAGFPNTRDVGVVLLQEPIFVPHYGQLPTLGQFDYLDTRRGKNDPYFEVVGYGTQAIVPIPFGQSDWVRYHAQTRLSNTRNQYTNGYNFQFQNNPGKGNGSGGTCYGDSGGPAFFQDTLIVAAITSFGITKHCTGTDYSYRTDIAEVFTFVTPMLSYTAP